MKMKAEPVPFFDHKDPEQIARGFALVIGIRLLCGMRK